MKIRRLKRAGKLSLAEVDALEMIRAYSRSYSRVLKDPSDDEAAKQMRICEDYIVLDSDMKSLVGDPLEFLYRLDKQIEEAHERRLRRCRR
jgi:hypothetical protein